MSEGHKPSEPSGDWRYPTAQEVNLIRHENVTMRKMIEQLNVDIAEGRRLLAAVRVGSHHHLHAEVTAWLKPVAAPDEPTDQQMEEFDMAHMQAHTEMKRKLGVDT